MSANEHAPDPAAPGGFTPPEPAAALRLRGGDAADLLQRLSASDLSTLSPGAPRPGLFCDDKGRLVAATLIWAEGDSIVALTSHAERPELMAWLDRYIIMEDVRVEQAVESWLIRILAEDSPAIEDARAIPREFGARGLLIGSEAEMRAAAASLLAQGCPAVEAEAALLWNLERGIPPTDGLRALNPLEVGLGAFVAEDKGCYVGQEVLARMRNYEKIRRGVALLRGQGSPPSPREPLSEGRKVVGRVLHAVALEQGYLAAVSVATELQEGVTLQPETAAAGILSWTPAA